jgi:hypothetical protein
VDEDPGFSRARTALAFASVVAAPLGFRIAAIADRDAGVALPDLRGVLADASTALLVFAAVVAVSRIARVAAVVLVALWTLLQYANFETVRVLGSLASALDAPYLADPTFLLGSALVVSRPALLALLMTAAPALAWVGLRGARIPMALGSAAVGALLLGIHAVWPWSDEVAIWRQTHFVPHNARLALQVRERSAGPPSGFPDPPAAMLDLVPDLAANLDGEPRLPLARRGTNVLLVVLESVSGAFLPSLAQDQGRSFAKLHMNELDAVARANLSWSTFVTHQRKTNRGLYALLCGELPNLVPGLPKMTDAAQAGWRTCLPEILRDAGYETVYLQAAPLAFMLKDQFMPEIGFQRVLGREWFAQAYARGTWGVDDRAFLEQSLDLIDELAASDRPWFLTLLSVGTHHPFVLPREFRADEKQDTLRALAYLDLAVGAFVRDLEERGVPDDTLVLFTSDESMGVRTRADLTNTLSQNWGFLIARVPEGLRGRVREPFAQVDLALSILDFLGLAERGAHFFGRSVFRRYDAPRFVFFANTNVGAIGALDPEGKVLLCVDNSRRCRKYAAPENMPFAAEHRTLPWSSSDDIIHALAIRSIRSQPEARSTRLFPLVKDAIFLAEGSEDQLVHGGQFVSLAPGEWIEVELEIEVRGPQAEVELDHVLRLTGTGRMHTWNIRLKDAQTLRMKYSYAPEEPIDEVGSRSIARVVRGSRAELTFKKARMSLHRSGERPDPGVQVRHLEVLPRR